MRIAIPLAPPRKWKGTVTTANARARRPPGGPMARGAEFLLPQPGGLEGFGLFMVEIDLEPDRMSAFLECPDPPGHDVDLDPASRSPDLGALADHDLVFGLAKLQGFDHLGLEGVWLHPRANAIRALDRRLAAWRYEHEVGVGPHRVKVTSVIRIDDRPNGFDVLFRHHLRSISPGVQLTPVRAR